MSYNLITANLSIVPLSMVTGVFPDGTFVNLHFSNFETKKQVVKNTELDGGTKVYSITGELVTLPEAPFLQIRYASLNESLVEEETILDGYISRVYKNHGDEGNLILSPRYGQDSKSIKHYGNDRTLRIFWKKSDFASDNFENIVSKRMKFKVFREGYKIYIKEILQ